MTIYLDADYKCYTESGEGRTAYETAEFDGKCREFIEGYRLIPAGHVWQREDGMHFGEGLSPWRDWNELDEAQRAYEQNLITQYEGALSAIEQALEVQT